MAFFLVKTHPWENSLPAQSDLSLDKGDVVLVESENGTETGIIEDISAEKKTSRNKITEKEQGALRILRKANLRDLTVIKQFRKKEKEALEICRREVKRTQLPMKVMNCTYSFDGGSITFAFTAEGRVDFRDLVKNLSRIFQRSIRLHQIGARDEARKEGGYGICGRELCCIRFKGDLPSISSEMAKAQQIIRRGSERISGVCGRLMCCLAYEADQYQESLGKMPLVGSELKVREGIGQVKEVNALTGEIKLELSDKSVVKINLKDL
ncbi:MAG: regulatory iron-sulfur-containing complex subunit RicT [Patescibacteria group bacterium]|nr:regulatory iron-sulfur-containing complex subunit RicT [Patescibacteria group bacterium]